MPGDDGGQEGGKEGGQQEGGAKQGPFRSGSANPAPAQKSSGNWFVGGSTDLLSFYNTKQEDRHQNKW